MDVWIVCVLFAGRVVSDVVELVIEVVGVSYPMFVIAAVPDCSRSVLASGEGVSAFDVLNAFCG